jgi:hypothetical protein
MRNYDGCVMNGYDICVSWTLGLVCVFSVLISELYGQLLVMEKDFSDFSEYI